MIDFPISRQLYKYYKDNLSIAHWMNHMINNGPSDFTFSGLHGLDNEDVLIARLVLDKILQDSDAKSPSYEELRNLFGFIQYMAESTAEFEMKKQDCYKFSTYLTMDAVNARPTNTKQSWDLKDVELERIKLVESDYQIINKDGLLTETFVTQYMSFNDAFEQWKKVFLFDVKYMTSEEWIELTNEASRREAALIDTLKNLYLGMAYKRKDKQVNTEDIDKFVVEFHEKLNVLIKALNSD